MKASREGCGTGEFKVIGNFGAWIFCHVNSSLLVDDDIANQHADEVVEAINKN